ncbi:hypothetical protein CIB48_g3042 [Xylaria polymorpha]|nr:hypothetical protein CIB48_g3042 [Xylaria polymorpha]
MLCSGFARVNEAHIRTEQETRLHFETFARSEFDKNIMIDKRDFAAIEFLVRKGRRQLDLYSTPGIKDIRS